MGTTPQRKKILYLVTQFQWGGAQKYIHDLVNNLDESKYIAEIGVGGLNKCDWLDELKSNGFKVWRLKHVVWAVNFWHDFLSGFELYGLFCKSEPDIIHLNSSKIGSTGAVVAWIFKKLHNKNLKIIYTVHGFVFNEPLSIFRKKFYLWSERISGKFKDKIICVSEHDKIIGLNKHIANHKKFVTIHNGIGLNRLNLVDKNESRKKLTSICSVPVNDYWIGTIANLYSTKGLEYLARAAKILSDKHNNLRFFIIGEGAQRKSLENKIEKLNLQNKFCLLGTVPKAFRYLKAFDIFCLSSVKEGFPYTLIEALTAGLPIVTTQVGGVMEIIESNINGLVVPAKKPAELAKALEKIITQKELSDKFRKNNLIKAKEFSLEKMIEKTEKIYQE